MPDISILKDIAFSIIFATISAHILKKFKQPLILAYVLGGIILGPNLGLKIIYDEHNIELISEIGLIFLLFIIGLEINIRHIINLGKNIIILSLSQFLIGSILTFFIYKYSNFLGLKNNFEFVYIAIALNLSSTLIVVKLLKDKFETDTLAGQITIGILVLQDIWAIIFMAFQPNFSNPQISKLVYSAILGIILIIVSFAFSKHFLSKIFKESSQNTELILLTSIAWCFTISSLAEEIGLSKEMGALIAGLSISSFPYSNDIITKISGIRDFFVTLFFVSLGLKFPKPENSMIIFAMISVFIVIFTRFISIIPFSNILKTGTRPLIITSINLSQISEFSLVIFSLGYSYGHISKNLQMQILISMLLMSLISTYLITYNDKIFSFLAKIFKIREEKIFKNKENKIKDIDILILGYFKETRELIDIIEKNTPQILSKIAIIDFNMSNKKELEKRKIKWLYGDIANTESLKHYSDYSPKLIVCTISDIFLKGIKNKYLLNPLKKIFPESKIILMAENENYKEELLSSGAFEAINPYKSAAMSIFESIKKAM